MGKWEEELQIEIESPKELERCQNTKYHVLEDNTKCDLDFQGTVNREEFPDAVVDGPCESSVWPKSNVGSWLLLLHIVQHSHTISISVLC